MVLVFGAYAFADGLLAIVTLLTRRASGRRPWPALLFEGIVGIAAGLVALLRPGITAFGLLVIIAAWAFVTGILEVVAAVRLRKVIRGEWLLAITGILSIALGVVLVIFPAAGLLTIIWWTGAYAIVFGVTMFVLGLRLRAWGRSGGTQPVGGIGVAQGAPGAGSR
jgi:uncharacterized membrane protein HdeD (DUF308 family)